MIWAVRRIERSSGQPGTSGDVFFDGDSNLIGQMWLAERQALYEAVLRRKPKRCFEIGTWTGGGSTFFIVSALKEAGGGRLYTIEADDEPTS